MKKRLLYLAIMCAVIGAVVWMSVDRHPFSSWCQRVSSTDHWGLITTYGHANGPRLGLPGCRYSWLSNHEVFHLRTDDPATVVTQQNQLIVHFWKVFPIAMVYDLQTHQDIPLYSVQKTLGPAQYEARTIAASPDGKWVYWNNAHTATYEICSIDGRVHHKLPLAGELYWLQGNQVVDAVQPEEDESPAHAILYDVQTPQNKTNLPLPASIWDTNNIVQVNNDLVWVTTGSEQANSLLAHRIQRLSPPSSPTVVTLPTPDHQTVIDAAVSPDGKQIVCLLSQSRKSFLARFLPKRFQTPTVVESLWACDINGAHMREIGTLPSTKDQQRVLAPGYVRWLPDSKSVSFVFNRALYVAPIE